MAVTALSALVLLLVPTSSAFANAETATAPIAALVNDPCTGELVAVTGTDHIVFDTYTDNQGGIHARIQHHSADLNGVGVTTQLNYNGSLDSTLATDVGPAPTQTHLDTSVMLIAQGSVDNFIFSYLLHVTVNANGEVTSTVDNPTTRCSG